MIRWILLAVVFGYSCGLCGCAKPVAVDADKAKAAVYALELQACVQAASTLAESRFCRCEVSKRYGRECDK